MDNNTVFIKTREGEDAVRQRTRLVQRNLRNILIMVDGSATVADLSRRFGDPNVAQAALAELAAGGFISEVAAASPPSSDREERAEDVPVLTTAIASLPAGKPLPSQEPPPPSPEPEAIPSDFHEYESIQPSFGVAEARQAPPTQPAATGWLDKLKGLLSAGKGKPASKTEPDVREEAQAAGSLKPEPIRRRKAFSINWPLLALTSVAGLIVLALLSALLFPYGKYLPDIEKKAAALLKEPVKIGDVGFSFLPRPHIYLSNIKVGQDEHLTVAMARAVPEFMSLTKDTTVVSELILEKLDVNSRGLGRLAQAGAGQGIEIRHISMNNLSLIVGDRVFDRLNGEVAMSSGGAFEKILLANADGTLKLEMKPKKDGYQVAASGRNWTPPFSPSLLFQTVDMQGELTSSRLSLTKIDGRAYGGLVEGKALLDWTERNAMLSGDLDITRTSAAKVLAALGTDLSAEGELTARVGLNAKADNLGKLAEALHADGSFEIKRGAAKGFDLEEAMRNTGRTPTRGGVTKFEQLNGTFLFDSQGCRLGNLRLGSGLFKAGGNLGIARNAQLSGAVDVELKGTAATLKIPLLVSGTTKEPLLTPSRGR